MTMILFSISFIAFVMNRNSQDNKTIRYFLEKMEK
jgi:hypothetical protein